MQDKEVICVKKILGIDTGGTYTDGVIMQNGEILAKTKTLTTRRSLQMCIKNCIEAFSEEERKDVSLVCLSTTLATNAIVEGRGCQEGLILIGGRPEGKMPTERYRIIQGRPDIMGRMCEPIDPHEVDEAIESFRGEVDALAVSGYASVRNPEHEIYVKERIREMLGVPVVCAHELTASLGFYDRTVTADLNAKLIPMICDLIDSVRRVMKKYHIYAPLMIVKGDGTLMSEECARDKPIETILSGPAASVVGGRFLSGEKDAVILDMGGTTTDLANITDGRMRLNNEGANVGGWFTRIRAAEVYTVGLGGDSRICLNSSREICVGPKKVLPYCMAASWFPALLEELRQICEMESKPHCHFWHNESEAFFAIRYEDFTKRPEEEQRILQAIQKAPRTLYGLQQEFRMRNLLNILEKLISEDLVSRIALTPTDLQHAAGAYGKWNADASHLCIQILAEQLGLPFGECLKKAEQAISRSLNRACIRSALYYDKQPTDEITADYLIDHVFLADGSSVLGGSFSLKKPVVAIGAPARAWAGCIEKSLHTRVIIPEHAEVANAVGAAVGQIIESEEVLIRWDAVTQKYMVFSRKSRHVFDSLDEATSHAKRLGEEQAANRLPGTEYEVACAVNDTFVENCMTGGKQFVERHVRVTAILH